MKIDEEISAPRVETDRKMPWEKEDEKPDGIVGLIRKSKRYPRRQTRRRAREFPSLLLSVTMS